MTDLDNYVESVRIGDEPDDDFEEWEIETVEYDGTEYAVRAGRERSELHLPEHGISSDFSAFSEILGSVRYVHESDEGKDQYVVDTSESPDDVEGASYLLDEAADQSHLIDGF
jgi:hypothetical protein